MAKRIWLCDNPECDYTSRLAVTQGRCPECGYPVVGYEQDPRENRRKL